MKIALLFILLNIPLLSHAQVTNDDSNQNGKLFIKAYGGISPLLSDGFSLTIPFQMEFPSEYNHDPGYNAGISVGYLIKENIGIQAGFENKSNRLFVARNFGAQNFSDISTIVTTNTIFINGIYYLKLESKLKPYFGIGGSLLQDINYDIFETDFSGSEEIGFRGLIGVDYNISEKFAINFELNFNVYGEIEVQDNSSTVINLEYNPLTLNLGLIYAIKL